MTNTSTMQIEKKQAEEWNFKMKGTAHKPAKGVMYAFWVGSWMMAVLWMVVSIALFSYNVGWSCLMFFCTLAFGCYLQAMGAEMSMLDHSKFEVKANNAYILFTAICKGVKRERMMLWKNLKWVEAYSYVDNPTLVLQGAERTIEIPLWAFGKQAEMFIQILNAKQIPILRIP